MTRRKKQGRKTVAHRRATDLHPKVKWAALVGSFLAAVGAGLAALDTITWQTLVGVVVAALITVGTAYFKSA
jgi:hypothetical protein